MVVFYWCTVNLNVSLQKILMSKIKLDVMTKKDSMWKSRLWWKVNFFSDSFSLRHFSFAGDFQYFISFTKTLLFNLNHTYVIQIEIQIEIKRITLLNSSISKSPVPLWDTYREDSSVVLLVKTEIIHVLEEHQRVSLLPALLPFDCLMANRHLQRCTVSMTWLLVGYLMYFRRMESVRCMWE